MNSQMFLLTTESGEELAVSVDNAALEVSESGKTASGWSEEELQFSSEKHDPLSPEALENAASYGLPFSLFGFAVVFGVLAIIMLVVIAFGKVFGSAQNKPKVEKKAPEKKAEVKVETPAAPVAAANTVSDNGGIVAAIMAAISAFRASSGETGSFRVVSFKKRK